jgi:hypothetical protein
VRGGFYFPKICLNRDFLETFAMLLAFIQETLDCNTSIARQIARECVLYSVKFHDAFAFQRNISALLKKCRNKISSKEFRLRYIDRGYFCLNLKYFCASLVVFAGSRLQALRYFKFYEVKREDAALIYKLYRKDTEFRDGLDSALSEVTFNDLVSLADIKATFDTIKESVAKYINMLTYKKLRFIRDSNNLHSGDLQNELMLKAIKTYYLNIPTKKDVKHLTNYVKRAVHNCAVNLIKAFTSGKRARLLNEGKDKYGGFEYCLQVSSENQMRVSSADDSLPQLENLGQCEGEYARVDFDLSVSNLIENKLSASDKKKTLLTIILGRYDVRFTEWLRKRKIISRNADNAELSDKAPGKPYLSYAAEYLKISPAKAVDFLRSVYQKYLT